MSLIATVPTLCTLSRLVVFLKAIVGRRSTNCVSNQTIRVSCACVKGLLFLKVTCFRVRKIHLRLLRALALHFVRNARKDAFRIQVVKYVKHALRVKYWVKVVLVKIVLLVSMG